MKTTAETLEWAYELDPKVAGQVAHYVDVLKSRIAELEAALRAIADRNRDWSDMDPWDGQERDPETSARLFAARALGHPEGQS